MKPIISAFFVRHLPKALPRHSILSGVGSALGIGTIAFLSWATEMPWLMAPFGATCVLLFAAPSSPLAQPINVVAGHCIASLTGLVFHSVLPGEWWSLAATVGVSIGAMVALRVTHPPAGADPIVVFWSNPGWDYLFFPVLVGSVALVAIATAYHKIAKTSVYPLCDK